MNAPFPSGGLRPQLTILPVLAAIPLRVTPLLAGTSTWTGDESSSWGDSRNWTAEVPGSGDTAIVNSGGPNAGGSLSVASLVIGGGTVRVDTANVGILNISGGTLAAATTTISSGDTWTGSGR